MNREILFKGKRLDNGQWVEGNYGFFKSVNGNEKMHHITTEDGKAIRIDPSTLCQFTGMTDIGDYKIFEGDIMRTSVTGLTQHIGTVEFADGSFCLRCTDGNAFFLCFVAGSYAVIGNVFDNPELLT